MAKPSINNAVIVLLAVLLGIAMPLSAWFLLRTMTVEKVIDVKRVQLDQKIERLDQLLQKFEQATSNPKE